MAEPVQIPKDLSKVKTKVFFRLTKRQLICFSLAAFIGVPSFYLQAVGRQHSSILCHDRCYDTSVFSGYV